ncbi:CAP domain-containing protein [Porphyrobacter sp. CACIAM 03H1]|uniref:CAP domain-containing protein n=1 Tax=Porphyrobacter sp. CACIAM 03H1 TaxID=2003315 RepID=UPI000B5A8171|nr:CAP domain-containing protein [Porphyrobacter sp. CACIAM 03H1]ASJ91317.1 SCP-like extracellular [Porphyrobacter sp. CACIAM 03H1]
MSTIARLACLALFMAAAPALPQASAGNGAEARDLLDAHNLAREDVGLPPLAWNERLARDAADWARHLARHDLYDHASPDRRKGQGENLWRGPKGHWSAWDKVGFFVAERRHFRPGRFPDVSRTGHWADVGHYTQVIWPETREVGCALAHTATDEVLVCRYWPAGNIWGQRIDPREHVARR